MNVHKMASSESTVHQNLFGGLIWKPDLKCIQTVYVFMVRINHYVEASMLRDTQECNSHGEHYYGHVCAWRKTHVAARK